MNSFGVRLIIVFGVLSAMTVIAWRCFGPQPAREIPPPPSAARTESVRVVASERRLGPRPVARPTADVSAAVRTVCGLDAGSAASYPLRATALRSLSHRRDLPPDDVAVLMGYLVSRQDAMEPDRVAGLKNELLNLLRFQNPVPSDLAPILVEMIDCGEYDNTMVDYCLQHLGSMWNRFASEDERERARTAFASAASRHDVPYAGTALNALAYEPDPSDAARRRLRRLTLAITDDDAANPIARVTAFLVAGRLGYTEALPAARRILRGPRINAVLAMTAVGAVGQLGGVGDVPLLENLREHGGMRLRPAVDAALARLGR